MSDTAKHHKPTLLMHMGVLLAVEPRNLLDSAIKKAAVQIKFANERYY